MTTGLIICGALAREVLALVDKYGWDVEVAAVPAVLHMFPERIPPAVEKRITELRDQYDRLICVYADCGTGGALDGVLERLGIERIAGPHCYEWYGGTTFNQIMEEEPGTYFLTDFMVRQFRTMILHSMGLDRFPELKEDYFRNYNAWFISCRSRTLRSSNRPKPRHPIWDCRWRFGQQVIICWSSGFRSY